MTNSGYTWVPQFWETRIVSNLVPFSPVSMALSKRNNSITKEFFTEEGFQNL